MNGVLFAVNNVIQYYIIKISKNNIAVVMRPKVFFTIPIISSRLDTFTVSESLLNDVSMKLIGLRNLLEKGLTYLDV